ncbi:hypothetical protein JD844_001882 [Phrynosoma platyrhinos]|uniref:Transmembrane protein 92 n=1 Tax=Phrynosoma platyrhinos TaxID=52577 RepID=A0ABQ7TAP5_PHRPL|nr:hypothetical protein JD844_001882 [Phrynosoma platyrhinos]
MLKPNVAVEGLLICLFTAYQEVLSFGDCDYIECVNNVCTCKSSKPSFDLPDWTTSWIDVMSDFSLLLTRPVFVIFGLVLGCGCFLTLCIGCCKFCKEREVTRDTEEPTARVSTPPPPFVIPVPSAPPGNQFVEPPAYEEVSWKPYYYPPPTDQPPAYDNIAMEVLPPPDASQPLGSVPRNNS